MARPDNPGPRDEDQLGGAPSGNSYSLIGYNECACGNADWEWDSDHRTGSSYKACKACGHLVLLNRGYIDPAMGIALSMRSGVGSWDTLRPAPGFVSHEISGVSL